MSGWVHVKRNRAFYLATLLVCLLMAGLLSPFASPLHDGLERVAHDLGFLHRADTPGSTWDAPLSDYQTPGVDDDRITTSLAGVIGVFAALAVATGAARLLLRRRGDD